MQKEDYITTTDLMNEGKLYNEMVKRQSERLRWYSLFESAETYIDKLKALRLYYILNEEKIISCSKKCLYRWYDSYTVDWSLIFTPIEQFAWNSIRCKGRIVLYPQYPVLGYFIDFANPYLKIGLELDGKKYHNKDSDTKRDYELKQIGWRIYRVSGSEMNNNDYNDFSDFGSDEYCHDDKYTEIKNWIINTGDGVIEAIKQVHFYGRECYEDWFTKLCYDTLETHCLI